MQENLRTFEAQRPHFQILIEAISDWDIMIKLSSSPIIYTFLESNSDKQGTKMTINYFREQNNIIFA